MVPQKLIRPGIQDLRRHMKAILSHGQCYHTAIFSTTDINMEMDWISYGLASSRRYQVIWIGFGGLSFLTDPWTF